MFRSVVGKSERLALSACTLIRPQRQELKNLTHMIGDVLEGTCGDSEPISYSLPESIRARSDEALAHVTLIRRVERHPVTETQRVFS